MLNENKASTHHSITAKEIRKPVVLKHKNGSLYIVYKNRVEFYKLTNTETKQQIDKANPDTSWDYEDIYGKGWNKSAEVKIAVDNSFRQVGLKDEEY